MAWLKGRGVSFSGVQGAPRRGRVAGRGGGPVVMKRCFALKGSRFVRSQRVRSVVGLQVRVQSGRELFVSQHHWPLYYSSLYLLTHDGILSIDVSRINVEALPGGSKGDQE